MWSHLQGPILVEKDAKNAIARASSASPAPLHLFYILKDIEALSKNTIATFVHIKIELNGQVDNLAKARVHRENIFIMHGLIT